MRVLVVQPCARDSARGFTPWNAEVGHAISSLQATGHTVSLLRTKRYDEAEMRAAASDKPGLILIHAVSRQADQARAMGAWFALNSPATPLFFFGPHASAWPADCMNVAQKVYVLRGHCDHLLPTLCEKLATTGDFFSLPGLSFPVLNRFYHNPIETPPELSSRPAADRTVSDYATLAGPHAESIGAEIETSRGDYGVSDRTQACFDMSAPQTGVVPPFQQRSVSQVVEEVLALKRMVPGARFVGLRDEHCLADPIWVAELCHAWRWSVGMPFWVCTRPEYLRESVFEQLAEAGCFRVHLVVESGSEIVRRRVINRRLSDTHLMYVARACRRFRMAMVTINEVGFPGETEEMVQATVDLNRRMKPDWTMCSLFHPEPGTALYQRCDAKKWLTASSYGILYDPEVRVEQPWIRSKKIEDVLENFNDLVFGPPAVLSRR